MENVYIVSAKRTAVGRFQGALKSITAPRLGAAVLKALSDDLKQQSSTFQPDWIDEVIMGQVLTAGVGQAPARQATLYAGLPQSVPALTIGKVCGSGLKSVMLGYQALRSGEASLILAGGQENMSSAPYLLKEARDGFRLGHKEIIDSMMFDGLFDPYYQSAMGLCAESCVKEFQFTRQQQDEFAKSSYEKARAAMAAGKFKNEIVPLEVALGKTTTVVDTDEEPGFSDLSKMASLKPAFDKEGTITAANASKINDGAAAVVLATESMVKKCGWKPLARVISMGQHAQDPKWFTTAPVEAMRKAISKAKLQPKDVDLYEINEAFSVVTLAAMSALELPAHKVNVNGGAVAIGHPIGASGARVLVTLLHALADQNLKTGVASLCIGGGEAVALLVERC
jgi:acetyl-CoA C-acetyltransferase